MQPSFFLSLPTLSEKDEAFFNADKSLGINGQSSGWDVVFKKFQRVVPKFGEISFQPHVGHPDWTIYCLCLINHSSQKGPLLDRSTCSWTETATFRQTFSLFENIRKIRRQDLLGLTTTALWAEAEVHERHGQRYYGQIATWP